MSETYAKLFSSILRSSVWAEPMETKLVWITLLALADRDGYVGASIPGIAKDAGVPIEKAKAALDTFLSPDPYSRSKEHEGRRIEESDRGWTILNYERFRDMRDEEARKEYERNRKREARLKKRGGVPDSPENSWDKPGHDADTLGQPSECPTMSAHSSTSASDEEGRKEGTAPLTDQQKALNSLLIDLGIYDIVHRKRLALVRRLDEKCITAEQVAEMWKGLCDRYPKRHDRAAGLLVRMLEGDDVMVNWATLKHNKRKGRAKESEPNTEKPHIPNMPIGTASCQCRGCVEFRKKQGGTGSRECS